MLQRHWQDKNARSTVEMNDPSSRSAIAGRVGNMEEYDIAFVGFPIWWYGNAALRRFYIMKKFRLLIGLVCMTAMLVFLMACGSSDGSQETSRKTDTSGASETAVSQQEETEEGLDTGAVGQTGEQDTTVAEPTASEETGEENEGENSKALVAYFSATGTTKKLAEYAADAIGADLYEIVPQEPYTDDDLNYNDRNTRATLEQNDKNVRPAISGSVENMDQYEIVFLAFAGGIIGLN